jgi:hypothetical protein
VADNVAITAGSGTTIGSDDVGGVQIQRVKATWGPDGTANDTDVATGKPMPVQLREPDGTDVALAGKVGGLTEAAPGSDTASSGLNGRLQRIAQRLTSLIALLPTALGAQGGLVVEGVASGTAVPVSGTVTANLGAGTNTNEVVGDVAHSVGVSGNPVLIAGVAQAGDDTAPPNRVDAESDATRLATDFDGAVYVRPHGPQVWSYHLDTSSAQTDTQVHASPGAGLSLYVGSIVFSSGAATAINLFFEEGASKVLGPFYLEAVAGRGMAITFNPPKKITAATALTLTTSAAIAHSVDVTGFTAQG